MKNKQYIVNVSDGRFTDDWIIVEQDDISEYAKYGSYASIWVIDKKLTEKEKKELVK